MNKISIIGAGAWGTTIANTIANNSYNVCLLTNRIEVATEINEKHTNSKYADGMINMNITATNILSDAIQNSELIFLVLPSNVLSQIIIDISNLKDISFNKKFIICTKGIDSNTNVFFSELIKEKFHNNAEIAVLSGPNFAEEVFQKIPTITTIATKNYDFYEEIQQVLECNFFKTEYFDDVMSLQLCGLIKNITAILCGIAEGLQLGRNTHAAIVVKGTKEIEKLCIACGCNTKVITTSAGVGDLVLTCSSLKSRNMNFGYLIGQGNNINAIIKNSNNTIEGLLNAQSLSIIERQYNVKNSLSGILLDIIKNNYSKNELKNIIINLIK